MKTSVPSWCEPWPCSWCWYVATLHTRRICCHGSWLQFQPGLLHFSTKEWNTSQWLLQIYVRMCLWQLSKSTSVCGVVKCMKEPGLQGLGEIRKQGKGYRWENECWQLSEFQWSVLAGTSWTAVNFSIWKTQISFPLVQLKKMFIFEIRDEQMEESDFFSANPEPYCSRKCKVIESVVMIQSRKVTG